MGYRARGGAGYGTRNKNFRHSGYFGQANRSFTIRGTPVLIKKGEGVGEAYKRTTGKNLTVYEEQIYNKRLSEEEKQSNVTAKRSLGEIISSGPQTEAERVFLDRYYASEERAKADYNKFMEEMGEGSEEGYDVHGNILPEKSQPPKMLGFEPTLENMNEHLKRLHPIEMSNLEHFLSYDENRELTNRAFGGKVSKETIERVLKLIKEKPYFK